MIEAGVLSRLYAAKRPPKLYDSGYLFENSSDGVNASDFLRQCFLRSTT
jgi:hypothetical protein